MSPKLKEAIDDLVVRLKLNSVNPESVKSNFYKEIETALANGMTEQEILNNIRQPK